MKIKNNLTFLVLLIVAFCAGSYYFYINKDKQSSKPSVRQINKKSTSTNLGGLDPSSFFEDLENSKPSAVKNDGTLDKSIPSKFEFEKPKTISSAVKKQQLENIFQRAKVEPLVPEGFDWEERKHEYAGLTSIRSFHPDKDVTIESLISENSFTAEDKEEAVQRLFRTSAQDFEPVKGYPLESKNIQNIQVFQLDDEKSPIYLITGTSNGREVYFGISGKMNDIRSELDKIKKTFSNLEVKK